VDERAIKRAQQILWYRGDLSWKLHAGQMKIEEAFQKRPGNLFVADCARQFGKTVWCAVKDTEFAIKRPKANIRGGHRLF
jgi:hypothetical protein